MQNEQQNDFQLVEEPKGTIRLEEPKRIAEAEWCFQFFDNEPIVFAYSKTQGESSNLTIELRPVAEDTLVFKQNGMLFKIFPREMSEESKQLRDQQNANQNQEAAS